MSYFASSKNKAIWTKRLNALRREKEERAKNGFKPTERKQIVETQTMAPGRRPITFAELVAKCEARAAQANGLTGQEASMGHSKEALKAASEARKAKRMQKESPSKAM